MYKGIKGNEVYPYIARAERDDPNPTIWGLMPQTVRKGNRNMVGYMKSQGKHTDDAIAEGYTKQDLNQFLNSVAWVRNFCFADDNAPRELIEDAEELKKVFFEIDMNLAAELQNSSRDVFALRDGEKNASSSSSGAASSESTRAGSASIAKTA